MANYPSISVSATLNDATGLTIKAWDKVLQMKAQPEEIFFKFGGNFSSKTKTIPNAIMMKMPANSDGASDVTYPLLMPLSSDANYGTGTDPITNAEQQSLRQFTAYYNDYDKSVKGTFSGIEYIEGKPYGILEKITPQISQFLKEMFGYWARHCLINGISPNIQSTPVSQSTLPHPNTLVKGVALAQQPSERYTTNSNLLASIIATQLGNVPAGTAGALDQDTLLGVSEYLTYTKPLMPLSMNGDDVFIMTVPTSQKTYLLNTQNTDGLGAVWAATSRYPGKDANDIPGYLGKVGNLVLIEDPRAPVAKAYGTGSGSAVASATNSIYVDAYYKPGSDERGTLGTTDVMEACFILGKGAIADLEPEKPHFENESQYLNKVKIRGALGSRGMNRVEYDKSTGTNTSKVNQGSSVLWVRRQTTSI